MIEDLEDMKVSCCLWKKEDVEFDIMLMIDVMFLLFIFFIVVSWMDF